MIPSFEGWRFYEVVLTDGAGGISEWIRQNVEPEEQATIDALLLNYHANKEWEDLWATVERPSKGEHAARIEPFNSIVQISVEYVNGQFTIYATRGESIHEFIMLLIRRGKIRKREPAEIRNLLEERITLIRSIPRQYREYEID